MARTSYLAGYEAPEEDLACLSKEEELKRQKPSMKEVGFIKNFWKLREKPEKLIAQGAMTLDRPFEWADQNSFSTPFKNIEYPFV